MQKTPDGGDLSRRRLFKLGLGGAAGLFAAGAIGRLFTGDDLRPGEVALGLTPHALHVVAALVEALLPEEEGFPSGLSLGVHQRVDEEAWAAPPLVRDDINSAIMLLEHAPLLLGFGSRLSRLPVERRAVAFDAMMQHRARLLSAAATSVRQMIYVFYYGHSGSWAGVGYDGPYVPEPRPPESALRYRALLQERG